MSKREAESDGEYVPEEEPSKKPKGEEGMQKNEDGDLFWDLGRSKRVSVRKFKGNKYIDFREFYEKDGKMLPGKKGLSLNVENFKKFVEFYEQIKEQALA